MATLYVNMKPGRGSLSADAAEALTTSGTTAATTAVTKTKGGVVTLYSAAAHYVSVGAAPNAQTDTGRFILFPGEPLSLVGVPDGMKVAAVTA